MAQPTSVVNFNSTTPAAPAGRANVQWQTDNGFPITNISASYPTGLSPNYTISAINYTITTNNGTVEFTASATATLPDATTCSGSIFAIIAGAASITVTIATVSAQTINGQTNWVLVNEYQYVQVQSNGTNWRIIANN